MPVFVRMKLFVCSSHSITGDGNRGQDWPQCLNALMGIVRSHWGIVSYLTKMIMLPLSPVTCHHLYLNSEPRRKAWAETVDRIRHGHQVTSSEYWTDTGDNQTSEQGQKTRAESLKHPDMGPSSWPGDTEMGFGVRMTSGRLSILNILFSPLCPFVCVVCPLLELGWYTFLRDVFYQDNIQRLFSNRDGSFEVLNVKFYKVFL